MALIVAGIDPGRKGYVVKLSSKSNHAWIYPLDYTTDCCLNSKSLNLFLLHKNKPEHVIMERPQAMKGAKGQYNMGLMVGQIWQIAKMFPHSRVPPKTWQKKMHNEISKGTAKERTKQAYHELFPHDPLAMVKIRKDRMEDARDALLISVYGVLRFGDNKTIRPWIFENEQ